MAVIPRKVNFFGATVYASAGDAHNIAIAVKRREFQGIDSFAPCPSPLCRFKGSTSSTAKAILCPRRTSLTLKSSLRFNCETCRIKRMCYECMKLCHTKHRVLQVKFQPEDRSSAFCECGIQLKGCRLLPIISEGLEFSPEERTKVTVIQRAVRAFIARRVMKTMVERRRRIRYLVCANYWTSQVLEPIWSRVKTGVARHHEALERHNMGIEEDNRRKYDYYLGQQKTIMRMNAMLYAIRFFLGVSSIHVNSGVKKIEERPTYAFSGKSLRYQQNLLHFNRRLPPSEIVKPSEFMPHFDPHESIYFDPDTRLLYGRFMRDIPTLKWLKKVEDLKLSRHEAKVIAAREASIMRRKARAMKARVMKEAKELQLREVTGEESTVEVESIAEEISRPKYHKLYLDEIARNRRDQAERLLHEAMAEEADDRSFDALRTVALPLRRRHSITDPSSMYARLQRLRPDISLKSFSHRRSSLPPDVRVLKIQESTIQRHSAYNDILRSLELFAARNGQLLEFVDPQYSFLWEKIPPAARKRRMLRLIRLSWLSPRLPREVREWVQEDRAPRRRTIIDSERLAKQLQLMFLIRNNFGKLRNMALFAENSLVRRRSFDFGEVRDHEDNTLALLGYQLEYPMAERTIDELLSDNEEMKQRMSNLWLPDHLEEEDRIMASYLPENYQLNTAHAKPTSTSRYWKEYFDPDTNLPFYYCEELGQSSWEPPLGADDMILYRMFDVETGAWFYYNHVTEESIWASVRPQL